MLDKYKAKAFIDTFMYRAGDVVGAQAEGVLGRLGLAMGGLVSLVVPLALVWAGLALWLGHAHAQRARRLHDTASLTDDAPPDAGAAASAAAPPARMPTAPHASHP